MKAVVGAVLACTIAVGGLSACGSSGSSSSTTTTTTAATTTTAGSGAAASDKVCAARKDLRDSVDAVANDVEAGNFGDARTAAKQVRTDLTTLRTAVSNLGQTQRAKLESKVDEIESTAKGLTSAGSLAELKTGLKSIGTQVTDLVDSLGSELGCS